MLGGSHGRNSLRPYIMRAGVGTNYLYIGPYDYYCNHFLYIDFDIRPLYTRTGAYKNPA